MEAGAPPGRIAALITSIVDNCRVEVSNIHIRIEDRSSSDQPFAFGVKLQSIALESVDKLFQMFFKGTFLSGLILWLTI